MMRMSGTIPLERMTPEEIARLKLRYSNRDGSAEVLTSKAWAHIQLQDATIARLESELSDALTDLNTARQDNASFGPEFKRLKAEVERLRSASQPIIRVIEDRRAHGGKYVDKPASVIMLEAKLLLDLEAALTPSQVPRT
jgi:capsule polysaccharide export protein KpsE/RkpR